MSKIPFTLDAWLKDKGQKIETAFGEPAKIVFTEGLGEHPILAVIYDGDTTDSEWFTKDGKSYDGVYGLFLITPDEELTAFETGIRSWIRAAINVEVSYDNDSWYKDCAKELLSLAREQFIKDGYIIEKKAFYDAVENIYDRNMVEVNIEWSLHCNVEDGARHAVMDWEAFQKVAKKFINIGVVGALKDLPKWKKWGNGACGNGKGIPLAIVHQYSGYKFVDALGIQGEKYIMLSDLEKLPGFKEDESHE